MEYNTLNTYSDNSEFIFGEMLSKTTEKEKGKENLD